MTDQEILALLAQRVQKVVETSRSWHSKNIFKPGSDANLPDYYPGYRERVYQRDRIRVHAELDHFPEHLFRERAPRQTAEELAYLRANFKQTTLPVYLDFQATVQRVFHDANWSMTLREPADSTTEDTLADYLEHLPLYGTYETWFKNYLPHQTLIDANALVAYRPTHVPTVEVEDEEGNVSEVIGGELLEPIPVFYRCDQVVGEQQGLWYLVELDQKAPVRYGNQTREAGRIFEYYDGEVIARATQHGTYNDLTFHYEIVYRHDWGRVPARKTGGIPQLRYGVLSFLSPFAFAVDTLDVALVNEQYLNAIVSSTVYPHRVMYGDPCDFEHRDGSGAVNRCEDGRVYDGTLERYTTCSACSGSGLRSRLSPLGILLIKPPSNTQPGDSNMPGDPLKFVAPDTDAPRFILEKIARDEQKARRILHLHTSADTVAGSDPLATGMLLDQKALAAFIQPISNNLFAQAEFGAQALGYLRYGEQAPAVSMTYPVTFDFLTEGDYLTQLSNATKAGLPPFLIQTVLYRYLQSLYYNDAETSAIFETIVHADRLLPFTPTDVAMLQARDLATKAEVVLHDSALTLVEELRGEYAARGEDFLTLPIAERVQVLRDHAARRVPGFVPTLAATAPLEGVATQEAAVAAVLAASAATA